MDNILKTTLLLGIMTGLFLAGGYMLGGESGMYTAFLLSLVMNGVSYWFSDKIVLSMHGAKPVERSKHGALYSMVERLAHKAHMPMPKLYIFDSRDPNAFATGRDEHHAAVAVSTGILELMDERELEGVLAHELSHVKNRDMLVSTIAATLGGAISMMGRMIGGFGMGMSRDDEDNRGGNAIGSLFFLFVAPLIAMLIQFAVSRSREFLADESGAKLVGSSDGLARALTKLGAFAKNHRMTPSTDQSAVAHLYFSNNFSASTLGSLFSTHPPLEERVKRLRSIRTR